ncbi:hypothetical protein SFC07_03725 [Corynebacterium callunae]|uniref:hypothetical protein n=1 Tax=Corynebacterium callunae TaxID=1721 RepID=UPI003981C50C
MQKVNGYRSYGFLPIWTSNPAPEVQKDVLTQSDGFIEYKITVKNPGSVYPGVDSWPYTLEDVPGFASVVDVTNFQLISAPTGISTGVKTRGTNGYELAKDQPLADGQTETYVIRVTYKPNATYNQANTTSLACTAVPTAGSGGYDDAKVTTSTVGPDGVKTSVTKEDNACAPLKITQAMTMLKDVIAVDPTAKTVEYNIAVTNPAASAQQGWITDTLKFSDAVTITPSPAPPLMERQ